MIVKSHAAMLGSWMGRCTPAAAVVLCATAVAGPTATLTPAERAAGWMMLFDGTSTDAWRGYRKAGFPARGWVVEDGCLRVKAGGGGGDIITKQLFEDFELVLEWKAAKGGNSGIMYRVTERYGSPWQTGPEMQILDDGGA
ncbi:MAG: 3-keto-disaccharide hydrolase, partial [Planctomycetota bacterium]